MVEARERPRLFLNIKGLEGLKPQENADTFQVYCDRAMPSENKESEAGMYACVYQTHPHQISIKSTWNVNYFGLHSHTNQISLTKYEPSLYFQV